ncbi:MAG: pyrimidine reductase family protein [Mycobacterium sp.]
MPSYGQNSAGGPELTLLTGGGAVDDDRLTQLYAHPAPASGCWVRANYITSLDGGATLDGTSGGLGSEGDRAVFNLMRELADVVVVGAGTVRSENYSGVQLNARQRQQRAERSQSEVPPVAVVTASGRIEHDAHLFTRTDVRPVVFTSADACTRVSGQLGACAEVVAASSGDHSSVDEARVLSILADRGLSRVLCEGGPTLLGAFLGKDLIDDLCLTLAPAVVGGLAGRVAKGTAGRLARMRRVHLLGDDADYLYARYVRR